MANFRQLVDQVVVVTNRPDLLAEIELSIKQSILFYHHLDFFWRDKMVGIINVTTGQNARHEIPLTRFPRMRAPTEIAPYFARRECCGKPLKRMTRLGECECEWWMLTPNSLIIRSATPTHQFQFTYWQNPVLAPEAEFHSWVADLYEDAVVDAACAKMFEMARDPSTADRYRARVGKKADGAGPATGHCFRILSEQLEQDIRSY